MFYEFEGKYDIVWNGRDVEMDLYTDLDSDGDIADVNISNAHYVDNDEPIEAEEIEAEVIEYLQNESPSFWGIPEYDCDDIDNRGFDCVDRWRYEHGIEF